MGSEQDRSSREAEYLAIVERRVRWSDFGMNTRIVGQRIAWSVALLAGAAVSLSEVLKEEWRWAPALLGFIVVVAQGADRLFDRTSDGATSMEVMRRALTKEKRLYHTRSGPYGDADEAFDVFVERVEGVLDAYDAESIAHL